MTHLVYWLYWKRGGIWSTSIPEFSAVDQQAAAHAAQSCMVFYDRQSPVRFTMSVFFFSVLCKNNVKMLDLVLSKPEWWAGGGAPNV